MIGGLLLAELTPVNTSSEKRRDVVERGRESYFD